MNLGGPTKVAELLDLDITAGGVQRVQNWMTRGIPPKVKLERPDLFLRGFSMKKPATRKKQNLLAASEESNAELRREVDLSYSQPADPKKVSA